MKRNAFKRIRYISFYLFLILFISKFNNIAFPWGKEAHEMLSRFSQKLLTDQTNKKVSELLSDTMANVSNIPDTMRNTNAKFNWVLCDQFIADKDTCNNQLVHWLSSAQWHFLNDISKKSINKIIREAKANRNIFLAIREAYVILKDKDKIYDDGLKKTALIFLIHLVQDVHQPLHVARGEDIGGGKIRLKWFLPDRIINLHQIWDTNIIRARFFNSNDYLRHLETRITQESTSYYQNQEICLYDWLHESNSIADIIYNGYQNQVVLDHQYVDAHEAILDEQLLRGGFRLAFLLNSIYDPANANYEFCIYKKRAAVIVGDLDLKKK